MRIEHDFPFDPTYGYDLDGLMRVALLSEEPDDLEAFWRGTYRQAMAVRPHPTRREIDSPDPAVRLEEVEFDAWGGRRLGGWLATPRDGEPRLGVVHTHGYGGRESPLPLPGFQVPAAVLLPCLRGFHRSAFDDLPDSAMRHVLHGIGDRETYIHRGNAADVWASASALIELEPRVAANLVYSGQSFGGGIGALAVPWDDRFTRAFLCIPSFGHYPLRLALDSGGSNAAVRLYHARHPEVAEVLRYFDTAYTARYMSVPTLVAAAKFDPAVPPPGQFSVYHALRCERELFVREYAHFEHDPPLSANDPWPTAARFLAKQ